MTGSGFSTLVTPNPAICSLPIVPHAYRQIREWECAACLWYFITNGLKLRIHVVQVSSLVDLILLNVVNDTKPAGEQNDHWHSQIAMAHLTGLLDAAKCREHRVLVQHFHRAEADLLQ